MKIDVTKPICDLNGRPVADPNGGADAPALLAKDVIVTALLTPSNPLPSAPESLRRYRLAIAVHAAAGAHDISSEDISLIKERAAAVYPPLTVGRLTDLLEGAGA